MANLNSKVKKYLEANSKVYLNELNNFGLRNDTGTDFIEFWNVSGLTEPTAEQLVTYESSAQTEENNNVIKATRKSLYGSWDKQLEEINEQGIDSWKARLAQIKLDNPKE